MNAFSTLWKFTRPHTIIGSVIGILTLYFIVCENQETHCLPYLIIALSIGITCNIFIVGINQIADVRIDKINKPYLPIPAGALSIYQAKVIVFTALFISLGLSVLVSLYLFGIIALAATIGWAYSMPPFYLKKHHFTAALAITTVRGVLLNAGGFYVFNYLVNRSLEMPENVKILTIFIVVFSIAISWFKDLADIEGDARYNIRTFAIQYSPRTALIAGNLLVGVVYLFSIYMKGVDFFRTEGGSFETKVLFLGNILLLVLFVINACSVRLHEHQSIKTFYNRFWWFFFAEYLLYLFAYVANS